MRIVRFAPRIHFSQMIEKKTPCLYGKPPGKYSKAQAQLPSFREFIGKYVPPLGLKSKRFGSNSQTPGSNGNGNGPKDSTYVLFSSRRASQDDIMDLLESLNKQSVKMETLMYLLTNFVKEIPHHQKFPCINKLIEAEFQDIDFKEAVIISEFSRICKKIKEHLLNTLLLGPKRLRNRRKKLLRYLTKPN